MKIKINKELKVIEIGHEQMDILNAHQFLKHLFGVIYDFHKLFPEIELDKEIKNSFLDPSTLNYIDKAREHHSKY